MQPSQMHLIPSNVLVDIASTTVFGAKSVELVPPADPSPQPLAANAVLQNKDVTVETNTVFQELTWFLRRSIPSNSTKPLAR